MARRTSLTYPDGRIMFGYGSTGSLDDVLSRVGSATIQGEGQVLAAVYTCAGAARYVNIASPEPGTELTYFAGPAR